ncbi:MAG: hypothetical protein DHS20C05_07590 [Hyphococcus sp.]|nr:MAG: hypothetical protein DHS20C05_07590 [Marinicaulis sp.]
MYTSPMDITGSDIVGFVGVAFVVGTYFLSQIGRMEVREPLYPALNGVGAIFILFSLMHTFNAASFVIEFFWLGISLVGFIRAMMMRASKTDD